MRLACLPLLLALAACSATPAAPSGPSTALPASASPPASPSADTTAAPSIAPSLAPSPEPTVPAPPAWRELASDGPSAREDHTWSVGDGVAYLFGGRDGETVHGDLWAFDLATDAWALLAPAGPAPAPRFGHEAEWVDGIGLVVFAGQAGPTFFADLWAYDPGANRWTELPSGGDAPVARYGTCAAIGPDGRLWISHGFTADGTRFADTRAYDFAGGTWTDETPPGDPPVSRCLHGCWFTDAGALALYAGQTTGVTALGDLWTLAPRASWSRVAGELPSDRNRFAFARDTGRTWVFGGEAIDGAFLSDLWRFDDDGGPLVAGITGPGPAGRYGAELIVDSAGGRGRLLLFGGQGEAGALNDLWELPLDR